MVAREPGSSIAEPADMLPGMAAVTAVVAVEMAAAAMVVAAVAIDRCTGEAAFTESGLHGLARRNALLAVVMPPNEKNRGINDVSGKRNA